MLGIFLGLSVPAFIIGVPSLLANFIPAKKHTATSFDRFVKDWNIGMAMFYIVLSLVGFLLPLRAVPPWRAYTYLESAIGEFVMYCGIFFSPVASVFMCASVILRRRGKNIASFIIQFIPSVLFAAIIITLIIIG